MARIVGVLASVACFCWLSLVAISAGRAAEPAAKSGLVRVAVFEGGGVSKGVENVLKALGDYSDLTVSRIKPEEIRTSALEKFDVVLFPGGSGSKQGQALDEEGRKQVRRFVEQGGGYVGICAGSYLATCDYTWSLHILDAKVVDRQHWARGTGDVELKVTAPGKTLLGLSSDTSTIYYHQGPLLAPAGDAKVPDFDTLATFAGDIAKNGAPKGVMPGTTAIAAGSYGQGRVLCFSPHPEKTESLRCLVHRAVVWANGPVESKSAAE